MPCGRGGRAAETTAHARAVLATLLAVVVGATAVHLRSLTSGADTSAALFDLDLPHAPTCDIIETPSVKTTAALGDPAPVSVEPYRSLDTLTSGEGVLDFFLYHVKFANSEALSKHGYVSVDYGLLPPPGKEPGSLPESYSVWDEAARALPGLVRSRSVGKVKEYLKGLPVLAAPPCDGDSPAKPCLGDSYLTRAHVILTHLAAVYIYYDTTVFKHPTEPGEADLELPEALAAPLDEIGERLQRRDGMDASLPNHRFSWADFFTMNVAYNADHKPKAAVLLADHISPAVSFVGGACEDSFIRTTLVQSGPLFGRVLDVMRVIVQKATLIIKTGLFNGHAAVGRIVAGFGDLATAISNMANAFDIINDSTCDSKTAEWWNEVGVWAQAPAPNFGPNGLQFVPMLVMDAFFGRQVMSSDLGKSVAPNVNALLANHRQLLDVVLQAQSIPSLIASLQGKMRDPPGDDRDDYKILMVIESYNKANDAYAKWLARHRQVAQRFIYYGVKSGKPRGTSGGTMRAEQKTIPDHSGGNVEGHDSDKKYFRELVQKERVAVEAMKARYVNNIKCSSSMGGVDAVISVGNLLTRSSSERSLSVADTNMLANYTATPDDASGVLSVNIRTKDTLTSQAFHPLDVIAVLHPPEPEDRQKLLRALGGDMETMVRLDEMEWINRIKTLRSAHNKDPIWIDVSGSRSYQEQCLEKMCDGVQVRLWDVLTVLQMHPVSDAVGQNLFEHWRSMERKDIYVDCAQAIADHFVNGMSWLDIVDIASGVSRVCMRELPIHKIADLATWRKFSVFEIVGEVSRFQWLTAPGTDNDELSIVMSPMQYTLRDANDATLQYQENGLVWHGFSHQPNGRTIVANAKSYARLKNVFFSNSRDIRKKRVLAFATGSTWMLFLSILARGAGRLNDGKGMSLWVLASTSADVVYLDRMLEAVENYSESFSVTMVLSRASGKDCRAWSGKFDNLRVICRGDRTERGYALLTASLKEEGVFKGYFDVQNRPTGPFSGWFDSDGCFAFPHRESTPSRDLKWDMLGASKFTFKVGIVGKSAFGRAIADFVEREIAESRVSGITSVERMKEAGMWAQELYDSSVRWDSASRIDDKRFTCEAMSRLQRELGLCLIAYQGSVYDITEYNKAGRHPGSTLVPYCGEDITDLFALAMHSSKAISVLENFRLGALTAEARGTVESADDFDPIRLTREYKHVYLLAEVSIHKGQAEELPAARSCATQRDIVAVVEGGLYFRYSLPKVAERDRSGFQRLYHLDLVQPLTRVMDIQLDEDERVLTLTIPFAEDGAYSIHITAVGPQRFTPRDLLNQIQNRFQPFAKQSVVKNALGRVRADLVCLDVQANFSVDSPPYTCSESDSLCQDTLNAMRNIVRVRGGTLQEAPDVAKRLYLKWPRESGSHEEKMDLCLGELKDLTAVRPDWMQADQKESPTSEITHAGLEGAAEHCVAFMDRIPLWTGYCSPEVVEGAIDSIDYTDTFERCLTSLLGKVKGPSTCDDR